MHKNELRTPAILVDLDILERNIAACQKIADDNHKQLWPMIKTHKSTEIALMQQKAGAQGFLGGTLDECEALCRAGIKNIMFAYPVSDPVSVERVVALAKACDFTIRLDCADALSELNSAAGAAGAAVNYTIIVDIGLHRFGMPAEETPAFANSLKPFDNLVFKGISTHPGHVYGAARREEVDAGAADERRLMGKAKECLAAAGFQCQLVTSGSTPTFATAAKDENINVLHPGNYVFNDMLQVFFGSATQADCSLRVLASVISRPAPDRLLIDAGAKCFGLDQGGHGASSVRGFGGIVGRPDLELYSLSEEVGKIHPAGLKVGERIEVIPNHACSSANLTDWLVGCRGDKVERLIAVDIRGNSTRLGVKA
ncbi:MAG: alanine racemase [Deltaproteobacteria bacterium]|jgi:D-serine deaminase-like pyridoxal phosphate-dependent protein|nr:alanine racemase [Deltaproteobacteria bacterium]